MLKALHRRFPLVLILPIVFLGVGACGGDDDDDNGTDPPENEVPTATITSPASKSVFEVFTEITFEGLGADAEDGSLTGADLAWSSSLDGAFGTGASLVYGFLSIGDHMITLTATDSEQATGSAEILITISAPPGQAPIAEIVAPADGSTFTEGTDVSFTGTATDPDGPELPESAFQWTSDVDGAIGTGRNFTRSDLSTGTHNVTLTVTDAQDLTGTATVKVGITQVLGGVSYAGDIQPYFDTNCVACHAGGTGQAGVDLDSYANVMAGGDNGDLVVAGDSNLGLLVPKLESGHQGAPHGTTIVQDLKDWIDDGALDN